MDVKTKRILESVEANLSQEYVGKRILIVLKAELNLLSAEHSFLTELSMESIGAPKTVVNQANRRLREIEQLMVMKEAEAKAAIGGSWDLSSHISGMTVGA